MRDDQGVAQLVDLLLTDDDPPDEPVSGFGRLDRIRLFLEQTAVSRGRWTATVILRSALKMSAVMISTRKPSCAPLSGARRGSISYVRSTSAGTMIRAW